MKLTKFALEEAEKTLHYYNEYFGIRYPMPKLDMIGIPERDRDGGSMQEAVEEAILETFESLPRKRRGDPDAVAESIRRAVRAAVNERWGKKPMCHVHVLTV